MAIRLGRGSTRRPPTTFQRNIKVLGGHDDRPGRGRAYFIRLSKTGDPNAAITYNLGNGGPTGQTSGP